MKRRDCVLPDLKQSWCYQRSRCRHIAADAGATSTTISVLAIAAARFAVTQTAVTFSASARRICRYISTKGMTRPSSSGLHDDDASEKKFACESIYVSLSLSAPP